MDFVPIVAFVVFMIMLFRIRRRLLRRQAYTAVFVDGKKTSLGKVWTDVGNELGLGFTYIEKINYAVFRAAPKIREQAAARHLTFPAVLAYFAAGCLLGYAEDPQYAHDREMLLAVSKRAQEYAAAQPPAS